MSYINPNLISSVTYLKNINWFRSQHTLKKTLQSAYDNIPVLYKSKHFLILNKPADLITYNFKEGQYGMPSLYGYLKDKFPLCYDPRLTGGFHVLHRLDSVTSGVICVPLNYFSQRIAIRAFEEGKAEKYYLALVYGHVREPEEFVVRVPIGDDIQNYRYSRCTPFDLAGKANESCVDPQDTVTKMKVLEYGTYKGKACSKVLIQLGTGKRHQIRVHCQFLGHPIVGDTAYGIGDYDSYRTMLHSYKLVLKIDTKRRQFLKAKAEDPFVNAVDADYVPLDVVNKLNI